MPNNIEEDIKILEQFCERVTEGYRNFDGKLEIVKPAYLKAIENILADRERLEKQVEYDKTHIITPKTIKLNFIPKQEIKEILKKYKNTSINDTEPLIDMYADIKELLQEDK